MQTVHLLALVGALALAGESAPARVYSRDGSLSVANPKSWRVAPFLPPRGNSRAGAFSPTYIKLNSGVPFQLPDGSTVVGGQTISINEVTARDRNDQNSWPPPNPRDPRQRKLKNGVFILFRKRSERPRIETAHLYCPNGRFLTMTAWWMDAASMDEFMESIDCGREGKPEPKAFVPPKLKQR